MSFDQRGWLVGAAILLLAQGGGCAKKSGPEGGGFQMPPTPVEVVTLSPETVTEAFEAVGTIEAGEAITVVAEIDGMVRKLPFTEGGTVRQGDLLAQLDDVELKAEAARTEATRDQAKSSYERIQTIVQQGAGAPQDLDDAAAALKVAEANFAVARARLEKTAIRAPWSGMVGARRISPGAFIRAGEPITDLAQVERLRVNFSAPERYLSRLARGSEVTVTTPAFPGFRLVGRIDVVEPVLDSATRSTRIIARVDNPEGRLRPGMSANISAVLAERTNALVVPAEAVFVEGTESLVYRVGDDGAVVRTPITLGTRLANVVEVLGGIEAGAVVVRAGHQKLYPGAKVMPMGAGGPPGGSPDGAAAAPPAAGAEGGDEGAGGGTK
ncbi:MAG: efflux RND transporter periplasmic adaptor subunit [Candidatus Eisenbacteria bacterium]|nr:efflux RND transporter periplasmic adaptor subunit [Candidatus Eisenbacteria bacterium]MCC7141855.1 efflux RND transporter periplasmic adaptor subunit [Candidatus Eisenbacteria bacterium]